MFNNIRFGYHKMMIHIWTRATRFAIGKSEEHQAVCMAIYEAETEHSFTDCYI